VNFSDHLWHMAIALESAEQAYKNFEVPVGAILVGADGKEIVRSSNLKEMANDPCGHAEILVIRQAANLLNNWRLIGTTLYVTLEPCPMCLAAMVQARISQLVFGAYDLKGGALSLGHNLHNDKRLNHQFNVIGGIRHYECSRILSTFFRENRERHKKNMPKSQQ